VLLLRACTRATLPFLLLHARILRPLAVGQTQLQRAFFLS
jgi:hypothetical protein